MISRRRMVFQLTSLLDLLLVVLFAQYMESQEATSRVIADESARRVQAESEKREADKLKNSALTDRSTFTRQIEQLTAENTRLREEIVSRTAGLEDQQKRAAADLKSLGEIFRDRLNIDPEALKVYTAATPGERERLLGSLQTLRNGSIASIVQHLRATAEFKKLSDLWEVHVFPDNTVRVKINGEEKARFPLNGADEFSNRLIDVVRQEGEPKSLVVILLTWSDAERWAREAAVTGSQNAIVQLRPAWGANLKRIELAKLGYSPDAP